MRKLRLFLDANVLVDALARDVFCTLDRQGAIDVRWSSEVIVELRRTLIDRLELPSAKVDRLLDTLHRAFPFAQVPDFERRIESLELPDEDDRHVLAAALCGECDLLVTSNLRDFPVTSIPDDDLLAVSIDEALMYCLRADRQAVLSSIQTQVGRLTRPPVSIEEFLERLVKRAPEGGLLVGAALDVGPYPRMLQDSIDAESGGSPQATVREIEEPLEVRGYVGRVAPWGVAVLLDERWPNRDRRRR